MDEPYTEVRCFDSDPAGEVVTAAIRHGARICMSCGRDDHQEVTQR